jgi:hypothetical protein
VPDDFADRVAAFNRRHGPTEAGKRLSVAPRTVERWADGTRVPAAIDRARAEHVLEEADLANDAPTTSATSAPDTLAVAAQTVTTLQAELERLRQDKTSSARERASVASSLTSANKLYAKLSGAFEITDAMVLRSDVWTKLLVEILEALRPFPDATKALLARIQPIEAGARADEKKL